jgi:hypothetical protein
MSDPKQKTHEPLDDKKSYDSLPVFDVTKQLPTERPTIYVTGPRRSGKTWLVNDWLTKIPHEVLVIASMSKSTMKEYLHKFPDAIGLHAPDGVDRVLGMIQGKKSVVVVEDWPSKKGDEALFPLLCAADCLIFTDQDFSTPFKIRKWANAFVCFQCINEARISKIDKEVGGGHFIAELEQHHALVVRRDVQMYLRPKYDIKNICFEGSLPNSTENTHSYYKYKV